jgi:hypothetical protein
MPVIREAQRPGHHRCGPSRMCSTPVGSTPPAVANGPQLRFANFAANSLTSCPHRARPVGLRGGCGVIGVGASRAAWPPRSPAASYGSPTQIDPRAPSHGPNGGVADSLDEAKAAFRAAWVRAP